MGYSYLHMSQLHRFISYDAQEESTPEEGDILCLVQTERRQCHGTSPTLGVCDSVKRCSAV